MAVLFAGTNESFQNILNATGSSYAIAEDVMLNSNRDYVILVDTSAGTASISLPSSADLSNRTILVKDIAYSGSTNNITLIASGSDSFVLNGSSQVSLTSDGASFAVKLNDAGALAEIGGTPSALVFNDYAAMSASLVLNTGSLHELRNRTTAALIGRWTWDVNVTGSVPIGTINLDNVSTSYWAQINGSTPNIKAGHNLPDDTTSSVTIFSLTGSTVISSSCALYVTGNTISFPSGEPAGIIGDDFIHVEGRCEFGELKGLNDGGGYWMPTGSVVPYWDGGLSSVRASGSAFIILPIVKMPNDGTPQYLNVGSDLYFTTASTEAGNFFGFGFRASGSGEATTAGVYYEAGNWERGFTVGQQVLGTVAWATFDPLGSSLTAQTLHTSFVANPSDTSNIQYAAYVVSGSNSGLTQGNAETNDSITAQWFGLGTSGPPTDFAVSLNGPTNDMKVKKIRYMAF